MWFRRVPDGFPKGFKVQRIGIDAALKVADLRPEDMANHFRDHPDVAMRLLNESYNKRYSPSTYITEHGSGFSVGWLSRSPSERMCERSFSDLADAATDYLLFSLGKGRWNPSQS